MRAGSRICAAVLVLAVGAAKAYASATCPDEQKTPQVPTNLAECATLEKDVRRPGAFALNVYEEKLNKFLGGMCHRNEKADWVRDKGVRDTGPWIGTYANGQWSGRYFGTHAPVVIWYSPDMLAWLHANRPEGKPAPKNPAPIPDGAMMVKEMYQPPGAACATIDPLRLKPLKNGAAVMVRDHQASNDGWFWGWYGFGEKSGWAPDWPAASTSPYPNMGFGQYCTNCHASAQDHQTFADLKNIKGEPGVPLVFLSQNFFLDPSWEVQSKQIAQAAEPNMNVPAYDKLFLSTFRMPGGMPDPKAIMLPPSTYDNVWVKSGKPDAASEYITSDQCVGCHSAGGTGLQFDMTEPGPNGLLLNVSPYGLWRGSPMGLAGRDPVFYAQLASETDTFHPGPGSKAMVQDTCLGCHGILGQRQYGIDTKPQSDGKCSQFPRDAVGAVPYTKPGTGNPLEHLARYGALARDGISCAACHRMVMGKADTAKFEHAPQNKCVIERQQALNPGFKDFGATFTGSFLVGAPDKLYGPFTDLKTVPMDHALGNIPEHNANILQSETCGACHTVHLPIMHPDQTIGHVYEQTTYPEWAFSDYRTGTSPDGNLPHGKGPRAQSCQGCHMPNTDAAKKPYRSKIASIQEYTNFPQAEHTSAPKDLDLPERDGFAKHTLVGLNVFLLEMAQQFFETLGIREADPMLTQKGVNPLPTTENAMLDQALNRTAKISVADVHSAGGNLSARVSVENLSGHKFPSGVGFRRAFVEFDVLDASGNVLWSSGRTNSAGLIVGAGGKPIAGELWWKDDCSARIDPDKRIHQPHYQEVTSQDQAQIYQELVSTPPASGAVCGAHAAPQGQLTTSFLSICAKVKDNRLLPHGFLDLKAREDISTALGADKDMAEEAGADGVGNDPDYVHGGGDRLTYRVPLAEIHGKPASVRATLYYQATPPFFLQDRFCTSKSVDTKRLFYVAGNLKLTKPQIQGWKLKVVETAPVRVP
ncbi:MAG TPA: cytochrome P460 family protein [Rhizomicrobium sp.]|nr:cytochrome P460 family protein [Rhizomicrobium sp.]